jgi:hypothetical protein
MSEEMYTGPSHHPKGNHYQWFLAGLILGLVLGAILNLGTSKTLAPVSDSTTISIEDCKRACKGVVQNLMENVNEHCECR